MTLSVASRTVVLMILAMGAVAASAETLKVGPGQRFAAPSQAFQAAKEGDVIEIDAKGNYAGDVGSIRANRLTLRGVGKSRVKIAANGKHADGKAIWIVVGSDVTVENIEFSAARVPDRNGAGIRAEGKNLAVRNCRFFDCENGILGGAGEMLVEHCEFDHCGMVANPATHSLYIGDKCTKLTFRFNYSTHSIEGHLFKSRAKENWILYNRLTDEAGTGSAVVDLPNGGLAVLVGNILQKGPKAQNTRVVAYGMEGLKHDRNALYLVNNTMVYENHRSGSFFVRVEKTPEGFAPVLRNNLCVGNIPLTNLAKADAQANLLLKTTADADFLDAAKYDYRVKKGAPSIDQGVAAGKVDGFDLTPKFQYANTAKSEPRVTVRKLDIGALEFGSKSR